MLFYDRHLDVANVVSCLESKQINPARQSAGMPAKLMLAVAAGFIINAQACIGADGFSGHGIADGVIGIYGDYTPSVKTCNIVGANAVIFEPLAEPDGIIDVAAGTVTHLQYAAISDGIRPGCIGACDK